MIKIIYDTAFTQYSQAIRLLLEHVNASYVDVVHDFPGDPSLNEDWQMVKKDLPLDFPNVPYLIDGEVKISQSIAILRYLGRKFFLDGSNDEQYTRIELIEQQIKDWRDEGSAVFYSQDFDKIVENYRKTLPDKMTALSKFLGDHNYLAGGKKPSYVDFLAYQYLDVHEVFAPGLLDQTPNLQDYVKRIRELPNVKNFLQSSRFKKDIAIYNQHAKWGNTQTLQH